MFDGMSFVYGLAIGFAIYIGAMVIFDWMLEREKEPKTPKKKKQIEVVRYIKEEK